MGGQKKTTKNFSIFIRLVTGYRSQSLIKPHFKTEFAIFDARLNENENILKTKWATCVISGDRPDPTDLSVIVSHPHKRNKPISSRTTEIIIELFIDSNIVVVRS